MTDAVGRLNRGDGTGLAWAALPGRDPTVVFLPGLRSDMRGSKAVFLRDRCAEAGQAFLRLDYSGHGESDGSFIDGSIGQWCDDAAAVIEARAPGPLLLVGSSMGGWLALLLMLRLGSGRVCGVVGIAAAPDFTEELMPRELTPEDHRALANEGVCHRPSEYGEPLPITAHLLEEGRRHLLLRGDVRWTGPIRLLQGMNDPDVPWQHALRIVEAIDGPDIQLTLIRDGDHRLSRPGDLSLLWGTVRALLRQDGS